MTDLLGLVFLLGVLGPMWSAFDHRMPTRLRMVNRVLAGSSLTVALAFLLRIPVAVNYRNAMMIGFVVVAVMCLFAALHFQGAGSTPATKQRP